MGPVDVRDSLAQIKASGVGVVDMLDFEQGLVLVLVDLRPSETREDCLHPQSELFNPESYLTGALFSLFTFSTFFTVFVAPASFLSVAPFILNLKTKILFGFSIPPLTHIYRLRNSSDIRVHASQLLVQLVVSFQPLHVIFRRELHQHHRRRLLRLGRRA